MPIVTCTNFLDVVFGEDWNEKAFLVNEPDWSRRRLDQLDDTRGCFWCIGAIPWGKGRTIRNVENVRALVVDDVGTKVRCEVVQQGLGVPTAEILTSPGNSQWVYRLSEPVSVSEWKRFFAGVQAKIGHKLDGGDVAHLFRLPMGVNRKPERGGFVVNDRSSGEATQ